MAKTWEDYHKELKAEGEEYPNIPALVFMIDDLALKIERIEESIKKDHTQYGLSIPPCSCPVCNPT